MQLDQNNAMYHQQQYYQQSAEMHSFTEAQLLMQQQYYDQLVQANGNSNQMVEGNGPVNPNLADNKLYQDYTLQMQKMKSQKEVDDMNFDEDDQQEA